ncbi:leukocyte elastase inhibitor-like [Trichogramma pretiosum]|uniref:leukocyte elastase inhibitor-like n=1 Tax=Trichogramma pretiosum TaxID=7493 RepID=UPI0006C9CAAD|nr:leukocyte elastase inhibitor-like [Trichogramma pretiosum]
MKFSVFKLFLVLFYSCQAQDILFPDKFQRIQERYQNHYPRPNQPSPPHHPPVFNRQQWQPSPIWAPFHDKYPPFEQKNVGTSRPFFESFEQFRDILSRGTTQLTLNIDNIMEKQYPRDNLVFSPLSLQMLLATILLASKGQTFDEITKIFNINSGIFKNSENDFHQNFGKLIQQTLSSTNKLGAPKFNFGTGVFVTRNSPIGKSFTSASEKIYQAHVKNIDYRYEPARNIINDWVKSKTEGLIPSFLDEQPRGDTKAIIASAIYFKGEWKARLHTSDIMWRFKISNNEMKKVNALVSDGTIPYRFLEEKRLKIVALPYKSSQVSMYVIVPQKPGIEGLRTLKKELTPEIIDDLIGKMKEQSIQLMLPAMNLSSTVDLENILGEMGLSTLTDPSRADLSVLTSNEGIPIDVLRTNRNIRNPGIFFDKIVQKVKIAVTEKGTEAAAATGALIDRMFIPTINANQPFLFFIRNDDTKSILFYGSIKDPNP